MSVDHEYQSERDIVGLLRDISGTEKRIRHVLLYVTIGAVGLVLYASWLN